MNNISHEERRVMKKDKFSTDDNLMFTDSDRCEPIIGGRQVVDSIEIFPSVDKDGDLWLDIRSEVGFKSVHQVEVYLERDEAEKLIGLMALQLGYSVKLIPRSKKAA